jgi:GntR family transcriptional regulator / MocR family aminotransferase
LDYLYSPVLKYSVVQMLPFKILISIDRELANPVYQQIANRLISLIREGIIRPGASLPSSREMASLLQVHRKTIVAAYEDLSAQDWIETIPRKGVAVSKDLPETKPRSFKAASRVPAYGSNAIFNFSKISMPAPQASKAGEHRLIINDGFPDARIAPVSLLLKEYNRLFNQASMQRKLVYGDPAGALNLRIALAKFLSGTRGLNIGENNILITRGAQMAVYLTARMIIKPGSVVIVGEPNYSNSNMLFQYCGAKLLRVPVDENGIDVDSIEKICKKKKPDLLYIIPHHHHPTTVTLSSQRRMKLLQLIRNYNFPVIEDDYDYDFHYNSSPILPLASADHNGNVIYIGSITKSFTSTHKAGYMVAPGNFIQETLKIRRLIDIRGDNLMEEALAICFQNGDMQKHLKKSLKLYHQRRDLFCDLLKTETGNLISFERPSGGMALWATFNKRYALPLVAGKAASMGLYMSDGGFYNSATINYNALRMGFASLNEKEMEETVMILKKILK